MLVYHFVSLPLLLVAVFFLGRLSGLRTASRALASLSRLP